MIINNQDIIRFYAKVTTPSVDACHIWTAFRNNRNYGAFRLDGKICLAHRVAYTMHFGEIQPGLVIDHACRNTLCVNPRHLEAVTPAENTRRAEMPVGSWSKDNYQLPDWPLAALNAERKSRTVCINGHDFTPENTGPTRGGAGRRCLECHRVRARAAYAAKKAAKEQD